MNVERDTKDLRTEAISRLESVARIAKSSGAKSLAEALSTDRIARLREERFHLVVLGESLLVWRKGENAFARARFE